MSLRQVFDCYSLTYITWQCDPYKIIKQKSTQNIKLHFIYKIKILIYCWNTRYNIKW